MGKVIRMLPSSLQMPSLEHAGRDWSLDVDYGSASPEVGAAYLGMLGIDALLGVVAALEKLTDAALEAGGDPEQEQQQQQPSSLLAALPASAATAADSRAAEEEDPAQGDAGIPAAAVSQGGSHCSLPHLHNLPCCCPCTVQ